MLAVFMSGRTFGSAEQGDAKNMPNHCEANPPMSDPSASPSWNGWSADVTNSRYQTAKGAGLTADQVPHLKLKWAFGYPTGVSAFGQPAVASGRVFVGSDIGYVYSLDAKTGCVYWSYQAKGNVRGGPSVGPVKGHGDTKYAVFFGDAHANVYAVDAQTGQELWTKKVDDHFVARITASPKLYDGYLYVPVSSSEEFAAANLDYPCCTSRGSVVKLNASTGEQAWKTYVIPETPKPTRKNSKGVQQYAPAGASVWNSPTIDEKRHAIYFGTGDSETEPAAQDVRLRDGGGYEERQGALVLPGAGRRRVPGRLHWSRENRQLPQRERSRSGYRQLSRPALAARRQEHRSGWNKRWQIVRARSGQKGRRGVANESGWIIRREPLCSA